MVSTLDKIINSPLLFFLFFLMIMLGLWLLCWGYWGGEITCTSVPPLEAGLGLNPPPIK